MFNNLKLTQYLAILSFLAVILTFIVIGLGAYTRLNNAGLGCPDWPGCYGHLTVPNNLSPAITHKAHAEMIHRAVAGTLGIFILAITFLSALISVKRGFQFLIISLLLFALVIYQITLGMWTVTLKLLPIIVTQHLMGGMLLLSLLWLIHLRCRQPNVLITPSSSEKKLRVFALITLMVVLLQISLGAWTSTNYAALICHGFPFCHAAVPLAYHFKSAFNLLSPIGTNYEGGVLSDAARMTIQMTHRFGALITSLFILLLFFKARYNPRLRKIMKLALLILLIQICLGISNVLFQRPVAISIIHNLFAAILLLCLVTLNHFLYYKNSVRKL